MITIQLAALFMLESQQQVRSMREWVTLLVTVTLATSSNCKRFRESGSDLNFHHEESSMSKLSEEKSFEMSKGEEKLLKDRPEMRKPKDGKDRKKKKQSESEFILSEEKDSRRNKWSESSDSEQTQKEKPNIWKNYARDKYGVEESVDLSILRTTVYKHTKSSIRKGKDKSRESTKKFTKKPKDKQLTVQAKLSKKKSECESESDILDEMEFDMPSKSVDLKEKMKNFLLDTKENKRRGTHQKKSENHSETRDGMEYYMPPESEQKDKDGDTKEKEEKAIGESEMQFKMLSKYVHSDQQITKKKLKHGKKIEGETYETSDSKHTNKHNSAERVEDKGKLSHAKSFKSDESKIETKASITSKKLSKTKPTKNIKPTVRKTKDESEEEYGSSEEYAYDDDEEGLGGHTYELSSQKTKAKHPSDEHASDEKSEEEDDNDDVYEDKKSTKLKKPKEDLKTKPDSEQDVYMESHLESKIKGKTLKTKGKKRKPVTTEAHPHKVIEKKGKRTKDKETKKTGKEKKKFQTTPNAKTDKDNQKERLKIESYVSASEEVVKEKRETVDPLEISTEELLKCNDMVNQKTTDTQRTTIVTTELFKATTLKPSGTDHWICPNDVKSKSIEINWDNYDSRGQKRMEEKPIDPVFRNKMKRFSTKELKGRLKQVAKRGQRKGEASFDASAALKRVRFNEVFKIKPIDDDDIFRNVTYQPTCSREFEVRMLEKNYRQKYGRRQDTGEMQKEFEYMLQFMGNHSKALSEETCRKIEDDEYNKLLACCDTQEISSMMADLKDSAPQKLRYLKAKGRLPLTTSEEIEKMEKDEDPEEKKRRRYKAQHKNKGKLKPEHVEMWKGENEDLDKEYIANTEEAKATLVSMTKEEDSEETKTTAQLTVFPGGRFINTEELEEMKKENEYYERMRKIGGRITRLYDPKNTLSSAEWAAIEATTKKPPRWSKPAPRTKVTVRGRLRRAVPGRSEEPHQSKESQDQSKESQDQSKESVQNGKSLDTVSEKQIAISDSDHDSGKHTKSTEHTGSIAGKHYRKKNVMGIKKRNMEKFKVQKKEEKSAHLKARKSIPNTGVPDVKQESNDWSMAVTATPTNAEDEGTTRDQRIIDSLNRWSSISSKNSDFFLDNRKQLRKRKSTDKRYNMVMNIIKKHARLKYNRSEFYMQTFTRRSQAKPTTLAVELSGGSTRKKRIITTLTFIVTPDFSYLMERRNAKELEKFEREYEDLYKHAVLWDRRRRGYTSDEYFGSASPSPWPAGVPTRNFRASQESHSYPDGVPDSQVIQYLVEKEERKKAEKANLFSEKEVEDARATWYRMKLHQFFYKFNITKAEWQRMMNPLNREKFNGTHHKYTNSKREYFIMPLTTWVDLANHNIGSDEFKTFNKRNRIFVEFCRGRRFNYSERKLSKTLQKPKKVTKFDLYEAYMDNLEKDYEELPEMTPSLIEEKTKRLRSRKNLTSDEEVYLALGGPIPYDPHFWPESFLQSDEALQEMIKEHKNRLELDNMETRERRKIVNMRIKKQNKKAFEDYKKYGSLLEKGKLPVTPRDIWHGYTGIRKKIWEYYVKEEEEREKAIIAKYQPQQLQDIAKKIEIDLERSLNETKSSKKKIDNEKLKVKPDKYTTKQSQYISKERRPLRKKDKKPVVGKYKPKINEKSRRDRAKERDKEKYGSEYSKIVREKYRGKLDRSYSRRSVSRERRYRGRYDRRDRGRYDSRDRGRYDNPDRSRYDKDQKRKGTSNEKRRYVDSRESKRRSSGSDEKNTKWKPKKIRKGRPERYKKRMPLDRNKKKKRSKRDIPTLKPTTIDPIFYESRSEYRGKLNIDSAWITRRRTYLAEKYARLSREEKEGILRKQGKLKNGETMTTKKPTTEWKIDRKMPYHKQLELEFMLQGLTKRANFTGSMQAPSFDEYHYEKAEREYMKRRKHRRKNKDSESEESLSGKRTTLHPDEIDDEIFDVDKYEREEKKYMKANEGKNESSDAYSYCSNVDKSYVTDHNPDYGSEERMRQFEENLIIDYKNKEIHFKNSPRIKYSKEDPTLTIPTWPTKKKNRGVRPQDRKKCFYNNPSTTDRYRQVLYFWHKYNQMKEAWDRKENIDDIPSLDSDY